MGKRRALACRSAGGAANVCMVLAMLLSRVCIPFIFLSYEYPMGSSDHEGRPTDTIACRQWGDHLAQWKKG